MPAPRTERARLAKARAQEVAFFDRLQVDGADAVELLPPSARPKMAAMLRAKRRVFSHFSESNFGPMSTAVSFGDHRYFYGYQRLNLHVADHRQGHPYKRLGLNRARDRVLFSFTNCGQSALSLSVLTALQVYRTPTLFRTTALYFETHNFLRDFGVETELSHRAKRAPKKAPRQQVLLVDSSTEPRAGFEEDWARFACVVIDTTCWSLGSPRIAALVREINDAGADVVLARSHIKLDCLGTEWNRLGSLLLVTRKPPSFLSAFRDVLAKTSSPFGARGELGQFYPFLQSPEFHALNERWVARLKASNRALGARLVEALATCEAVDDVQTFSHDLFTLLIVPLAHIDVLEARASALAKRLNAAGLAAHTIASYPWDFISLTAFVKDAQEPSGQRVGAYRISAPGLTRADVARTSRIVTAWAQADFT